MSADAFHRFTMHNFQCRCDSLTYRTWIVIIY